MPLFLFISAIIVFGVISVLGIVWHTGKGIYDCVRLKPIRAIKSFVMYWVKFLYQIWNVIKYFLLQTAIALDLFGNTAGGELIEDCVTAKENTLYGRGDWTVSAATGKLETENDLNKTGKWFTNVLSKILGQGHSVNAYLSEIKKSNG